MIRRLLVLLLGLLMCLAPSAVRAQGQRVAVIEMHGSVSASMASFVTEQLDAAWRNGYAGVIIDMDVDGGSDDAAATIKSAILQHANDFPIAAYVHDHALGPGSLDAIACKTIAMAPAASLGNDPDSSVKTDFTATAQANGRNAAIAAGFVSADTTFPSLGILSSGIPITLTTQQAQTTGFADIVATGYPAILAKMGLPNASVVTIHFDAWTAVARWIAQPWATVLLLAIGLALVITELATMHSWGLAGIIGGLMVLLIFAAHITVGNSSWVGIILFIAGLIFLFFETHILPGHGVSAVIGLIMITVGMYLSLGGEQGGGLYTLAASLLTTVGITVAFFAYLPRSRVWKKMGQSLRQSASAGYVTSEDYTEFIGRMGTTATQLRPSGSADVDGVRLAVVSEGDFIAAGVNIQVILVQGNRIVVRPTS